MSDIKTAPVVMKAVNVKRNRVYGLLILAVVLLPMLLAYLMHNTGWGIPQGTTNKGTLLSPPQSVKTLSLSDNTEQLVQLYPEHHLPNEHKRWRLMVPVTQGCGKVCKDHLYLTRQVHIRLAEKAYRVERILLLIDDISVDTLRELEKEHPSTLMLRTTREYLQQWLAAVALAQTPEQHYYLVDQEGFAMMYYGVEQSGQDLLDDLKKLLKYSYDK
jgi:hypothetical protein